MMHAQAQQRRHLPSSHGGGGLIPPRMQKQHQHGLASPAQHSTHHPHAQAGGYAPHPSPGGIYDGAPPPPHPGYGHHHNPMAYAYPTTAAPPSPYGHAAAGISPAYGGYYGGHGAPSPHAARYPPPPQQQALRHRSSSFSEIHGWHDDAQHGGGGYDPRRQQQQHGGHPPPHHCRRHSDSAFESPRKEAPRFRDAFFNDDDVASSSVFGPAFHNSNAAPVPDTIPTTPPASGVKKLILRDDEDVAAASLVDGRAASSPPAYSPYGGYMAPHASPYRGGRAVDDSFVSYASTHYAYSDGGGLDDSTCVSLPGGACSSPAADVVHELRTPTLLRRGRGGGVPQEGGGEEQHNSKKASAYSMTPVRQQQHESRESGDDDDDDDDDDEAGILYVRSHEGDWCATSTPTKRTQLRQHDEKKKGEQASGASGAAHMLALRTKLTLRNTYHESRQAVLRRAGSWRGGVKLTKKSGNGDGDVTYSRTTGREQDSKRTKGAKSTPDGEPHRAEASSASSGGGIWASSQSSQQQPVDEMESYGKLLNENSPPKKESILRNNDGGNDENRAPGDDEAATAPGEQGASYLKQVSQPIEEYRR